MRKFKFRVTATVSKLIEVEVDPDQWDDEDELENEARNKAHELFSIVHDGTEERYNEDAELITEFYYQPDLKDVEWGELLYSFEVYRSLESAQKAFPGREIITYQDDDIEDPTFVD